MIYVISYDVTLFSYSLFLLATTFPQHQFSTLAKFFLLQRYALKIYDHVLEYF